MDLPLTCTSVQQGKGAKTVHENIWVAAAVPSHVISSLYSPDNLFGEEAEEFSVLVRCVWS